MAPFEIDVLDYLDRFNVHVQVRKTVFFSE